VHLGGNMNEKLRGIIIGIVVILIGFLFLLSNLNFVPFGDELFWASLFLFLAYACYRAYQKDRSKWWALTGAGLCLFLAIVFIFEAAPFLPDNLIGTLLFWVAAAVFITVFAREPNTWWAIIPAGICIVLGTIILVDEFHLVNDDLIAFILFLGIGLTFGFLYGIKDEKNRLDWAKYPAVLLMLFSLFLLAMIEAAIVLDLLLPAGFIIVGGILIYRGLRKRSDEE